MRWFGLNRLTNDEWKCRFCCTTAHVSVKCLAQLAIDDKVEVGKRGVHKRYSRDECLQLNAYLFFFLTKYLVLLSFVNL